MNIPDHMNRPPPFRKAVLDGTEWNPRDLLHQGEWRAGHGDPDSAKEIADYLDNMRQEEFAKQVRRAVQEKSRPLPFINP